LVRRQGDRPSPSRSLPKLFAKFFGRHLGPVLNYTIPKGLVA
jgi:hypothetical protein